MLIQSLSSPSLFNTLLVVVSPVVLFVTVIVSSMMSGRRRWRLLTIAFLLVMITPDCGLGLLENAVRSCLVGQWSGLRRTFPMYVMERIATRFWASGRLKKIFLILVFLMCSSLTCVIFIRRILLMLRWMNEFSLRK